MAHLIPPLMYDTTNGYYDPETQGMLIYDDDANRLLNSNNKYAQKSS